MYEGQLGACNLFKEVSDGPNYWFYVFVVIFFFQRHKKFNKFIWYIRLCHKMKAVICSSKFEYQFRTLFQYWELIFESEHTPKKLWDIHIFLINSSFSVFFAKLNWRKLGTVKCFFSTQLIIISLWLWKGKKEKSWKLHYKLRILKLF